jgi:threonylcarbamoyladenosine tRNA methylthiotransferase MtaB
MSKKKVKIKTLGCRLNQYDGELLREELELAGFELVEEGEDIFIINSCAVTKKACREARNTARKEKRKEKNATIILTGCYPKLVPEEVKRVAEVDFFYPDIPALLVGLRIRPQLSGITRFFGHTKAFVKIQEGCDNFCAYCVVPYVRGKPREREIEEILEETKRLVNNGYKEIILTGTNVGKYRELNKLLKELVKISHLNRIGFGSIEPFGISDEMLRFMKESGKFNEYFHIPLQSGDNKILKAMRRWYTREQYLEMIEKIKKYFPYSAIGADVIVGFPFEGEEEFNRTYEFIKTSPIDRLHVFPYSSRPIPMPSHLFSEVHPNVKKRRTKKMIELGEMKWEEFRRKFVGETLEVHREKKLYRDWIVGVTRNYIKVKVKKKEEIKDKEFFKVIIKRVEKMKTYGEIVE